MFEKVLSGIMENETVSLYKKVKTIKPSGAESVSWELVKDIFCNIQANQKYGDTLVSSVAGDDIQAVYNLYTRSEIEEGQRVIRKDGILYEIRNVEHNGVNTILEHYKGYLTRVDNQ